VNYEDFLKLLVCPLCRDPLTEHGGVLSCGKHGEFPIKYGVPDFVKRPDSFDRHWREFRAPHYPRQKVKAATEFLQPIFERIPRARSMILDIGCGDGVHAAVLTRYPKITYIGLDQSDIVFHLRRHFTQDNLHFVRSDALALPFFDKAFEGVFSFGVFGYTPNPEACFEEMSRVLRQGGIAGLWLYQRKGGLRQLVFDLLHNLLVRMRPELQCLFCYLLTPLLFSIPTRSGIHPLNARLRQCAEIIAVNLLPPDVTFFDEPTILSWFRNAYRSFELDRRNPITVYGMK
jgi:SAM-dependent methyltransferase